MKKRKFGRTDWDVSEIGFGGWGIGRTWWGTTDDQESLEALNLAWESGVNFYDTAYVYGDGHSEKIIAQALHGKNAWIATKIPPKNRVWPGDPETSVAEVFPRDWIVSCTERSLKNLKRETIDLTQFHVWADKWLEDDEWKEAVTQLKKEGKLRAFGVSVNDHDPNSALKLVASGLVDSVQVIFNIFDQSPIEKLFPLCHQHNVAVIARVPFDEGSLSGTFTLKTKFENEDFRKNYFSGDKLRQTLEKVEQLKPFLKNGIKTLPQLALQFILSFEEVSVVIPGMRKSAHVRENISVSDKPPLPPEVQMSIRAHQWPRNFYGMWD